MTESLEWHGKEINSTLRGESGEKEETMTAQRYQIYCKLKEKGKEKSIIKKGINNFLLRIVQC